MSDIEKTKADPEAAFWEEVDDLHSVMLGVDTAGQHMQPMAPMAAADTKTIWFFTNKETDLAKSVASAKPAQMCAVNSDDGFYACVSGTLEATMDRDIVERFWSPVVAAWFKDGKDDDDLILLKFKPDAVSLWKASDSSLKFGWEIAKANLTDSLPDMGIQTEFKISGGAV